MSFTACVFTIVLVVLIFALFKFSFVTLLLVIGIALIYAIVKLFPITLELILDLELSIDMVPKLIGLVFLSILFYFIITWLINAFNLLSQMLIH